MPSFLFIAATPHVSYNRWWFTIAGEERRSHGPFPTESHALDARLSLFRKWSGRASALGGEAVRLRDDQWLVTLPDGVPCAGVPFRSEAVAHASPTAADIPTSQSEPRLT